MKKLLIGLSICMMITPFLSAHATTTSKKHHKKKIHHVTDYKQEQTMAAPEPAKTSAPRNLSWSNMSGTFALTSNYVFRGISQSENLPAAQGGLTYTFPIGLYFNVWGSNVKFTATDATLELDTIVGWRGGVGENFAYDINLDRYNYPGTRELNYNELNTLFNYRFLQAGISYSANVYNSHASGTYYNGGINYTIPPQYFFHLENVNLLATLGHYTLPRAAGTSYNDYNVGLTKKLNDTYAVTAQWTGTNGRAHNPPYDSDHLIATITATF